MYPAARAAGNFVPGFGHGRLNRDSTLELGSPTGGELSTEAQGPSTYPSVQSFGETAVTPTQKIQQVPDVPELPKENVSTPSAGGDEAIVEKVDGTPSPVVTDPTAQVPRVADSKSGGTPNDPATSGGNDDAGNQILPASSSKAGGNVGDTGTDKTKENADMTVSGTPPIQSSPENLGKDLGKPKGPGGGKKKTAKAPPAPTEAPDDLNNKIYDNGFYWKTLNSI